MEDDVRERFELIDARLDRITAVQETQAGLITGLGLQVGQLGRHVGDLGRQLSDLGQHVGDLGRQVGQLASKVDALVDSHGRLYGAMQQLAEAQKVTEQKLQAFINSLEKGHDGR